MAKSVPKLGQKQLRILHCLLENGSYPGRWIHGNHSSTMRLINSLEERDLVGAYQGIDFSGRAYTYYHLTALGRRIAASITRYQPTPGQNETEFGHRLNSRLIYDHNLLPVIRNVNATVPARKSTEQLIQEAEATNVVDHMPEVFALVERLRELEQQIKKGNTKP